MCCERRRERNQEAAVFYDDWYVRGYMDEWPIEKKHRVFDITKSLNLSETGDVLDFGCGNGEFTGVLKKALPEWNVYGTDISAIAIENAQKRHSDCSFFLTSDNRFIDKKFDLLFTHHVLEHVDDIDKIWPEIYQYLKKRAFALHILPCGNQGSFEYNLCMLKKDGIERGSGNRFYFEDKSHLRRLTTRQMNDFAIQYDFRLIAGFYSNQLYGALDWITLSSAGFILEMTGTKKAKDKLSAIKLICLRMILLMIKSMRFPANTIDYKKNKMKRYKYYFFLLTLLIFYPISKLTNIYLKYMSNLEWQTSGSKKNGSEMYLYYKRIKNG